MDEAAVQNADGDGEDFEDAILRVEEERFEMLLLHVAQLRHEHGCRLHQVREEHLTCY
jgi:hypothetical protein